MKIIDFIYNNNGDAVGYLDGEFIYTITGEPVGYVDDTQVYKLSGSYVGELLEDMVVDMNLKGFPNLGKLPNPGNIGHLGNPGNRGHIDLGYPDIFDRLIG